MLAEGATYDEIVDYISRENDIPLCEEYNQYRKLKLNDLIYPSGVLTAAAVSKNNGIKEEALKNLSRLTHKRELLHDLVSAYAKQRGWNIEETVHKVLDLIISREKNKEFKHKLTHFFK